LVRHWHFFHLFSMADDGPTDDASHLLGEIPEHEMDAAMKLAAQELKPIPTDQPDGPDVDEQQADHIIC
jgi:hypothetical protein